MCYAYARRCSVVVAAVIVVGFVVVVLNPLC